MRMLNAVIAVVVFVCLTTQVRADFLTDYAFAAQQVSASESLNQNLYFLECEVTEDMQLAVDTDDYAVIESLVEQAQEATSNAQTHVNNMQEAKQAAWDAFLENDMTTANQQLQYLHSQAAQHLIDYNIAYGLYQDASDLIDPYREP